MRSKGEEAFTRGKLLDSSYKDGIFTASGISHDAYHSSLHLQTLQRILSLITPDLAIVFDSVSLLPSSQVRKVATLFNNIDVQFTPYHLHLVNRTLNGMKVTHGNNSFYAVWWNRLYHSPRVNLTYETYKSNSNGLVNDSIANVTFHLSGDQTQNLFLFFTNRIAIMDINFTQDRNKTTFITVDYLDLHSRKMYTVRQICRLEKSLYVISSVKNSCNDFTSVRLKSIFRFEDSPSYTLILMSIFVISVMIYKHSRGVMSFKRIFTSCLSLASWQNTKDRLTLKGVVYLSNINGHSLGKTQRGRL